MNYYKMNLLARHYHGKKIPFYTHLDFRYVIYLKTSFCYYLMLHIQLNVTQTVFSMFVNVYIFVQY